METQPRNAKTIIKEEQCLTSSNTKKIWESTKVVQEEDLQQRTKEKEEEGRRRQLEGMQRTHLLPRSSLMRLDNQQNIREEQVLKEDC